MLPPKLNLPVDQRRLLKLYKSLDERERDNLLSFAEFLQQRGGDVAVDEPVEAQVQIIPRPQKESVVAAIKRLSATYPMLDRSKLLTETSSLMTAHIMHGKPATDAIDELEALFSRYYEARSSVDN